MYMKKNYVCLFVVSVLLLFLSVDLYSQPGRAEAGDGGITSSMLKEIGKGYAGSSSDKAIRNAIASTPINTLAANSENAAMIDTHFSDRVESKGITNQESSGRCWLFTGLNVLRAKMIEKYNLGAFTFSQNYVFFYDQLEKSNLFLQGVIDTRHLPFDDRKVDWLFSHPIGDGGQFTGISDLVTKYGLVPSDAMPETYCSNHTSQMSSLLKNKLREDGLALRNAKGGESNLLKIKTEMLSEIYHILAICLGVPPSEFVWNRYDSKGNFVSSEKYTPKEFYNKYVGADLEDNYVMFMNDPTREYGKVYEIDYDRHVYDGHNWLYVNLPVERIKKMAIASIKDSTAMYFSCDVVKFLNRKSGVLDVNNFDYGSLMGVSFDMDKRQRVLTHDSGSSHAITLIAVDIKNGKPVKWMVENSWGAGSGYKGCLIMTDKWFDEYMFRLVVEKKYVPSDILEMLNQKPIELPAWDPMFSPED
jgi:bleomycin hydrolase